LLSLEAWSRRSSTAGRERDGGSASRSRLVVAFERVADQPDGGRPYADEQARRSACPRSSWSTVLARIQSAMQVW